MNNKSSGMILGIAAIVTIAGLGFYAFNRNYGEMIDDNNSMMSNNETTSLGGVVAKKESNDYKLMASVTGEDYDRVFLANMIAHHKGALEMANLAKTNAKHQEIKDLASEIVDAQTREIADMKSWQKEWGYPASSGTSMMDHSSMGMMEANPGMMKSLTGKTGDEFDKEFLAQMIMHHQSAIGMASLGTTNAYHDEVKDLSRAIIEAQSTEILKMRQWQKDWGYSN